MNENNLIAKLEALLFSYGEPLSVKQIANFLKISEEDVSATLSVLKEKLTDLERGLTLVQAGNSFSLATKPELKEVVAAIVTEELKEELTPAALETLSLVAYLGPVARTDLDYIRGVNSSFSLRSLSLRGLVERDTTKGIPHYRLTADSLAHLNLSKPEDLPNYEEFRQVFEDWQNRMKEPEKNSEIKKEESVLETQ
jgi:segregation and condensation protein B